MNRNESCRHAAARSAIELRTGRFIERMRASAAGLYASVRSGFANRRGARHPRSNGFGILAQRRALPKSHARHCAPPHRRKSSDDSYHAHEARTRSTDGSSTASLRVPDESAWTARGLLKSGRDYDEIECQSAIAGFMAEHLDRNDIVE